MPPWWLRRKKNLPAVKENWVRPLCWEDALEEGMATHSSIPAWRIPKDRGAWWATVHGVAKSWTQLSDFHSLTHPYANCGLYSFGHILTKAPHACYIKSKSDNIQTGFNIMIPCVLSQMGTLFFTVFLLEAHHSVSTYFLHFNS